MDNKILLISKVKDTLLEILPFIPADIIFLIYEYRKQFIKPHLALTFGKRGADNGQFDYPCDCVIDGDKIYVVDMSNHRIQIFHKNTFKFLAKFGCYGINDGQFNMPTYIAIDQDEIYIADTYNHRIQIFNLRFFTFMHCIPEHTFNFLSKFGCQGENNDQFQHPHKIVIDCDKIYVADIFNHRIQVFDKYEFTFLAKFGRYDKNNGKNNGQFNHPYGLAIDDNKIYIADTCNDRIQVFDKDKLTFLSTFGEVGKGNGQFSRPVSIAVDQNEIYIADNKRIQVFNKSTFDFIAAFGNFDVPDNPTVNAINITIYQNEIYVVDGHNNQITVWTKQLD